MPMHAWLRKAVLIGVTFSLGIMPLASMSADFDAQEVEQTEYIAITSPYGKDSFGLIILQQLPKGKPCWQETGSNPTTVAPLLLQFNFKGSCSRFTDSNGYSVRVGGQDLGLKYTLRIVRNEGDLFLLGIPAIGTQGLPILFIARTNGDTNGFAKFNLNPGWRFTRRAFKGKSVGHVYLLNDAVLEDLAKQPIAGDRKPEEQVTPSTTPTEPNPTVTQPTGSTPAPTPSQATPPGVTTPAIESVPTAPNPLAVPTVPEPAGAPAPVEPGQTPAPIK